MMMCWGGMLFCSSQICLGHSGLREGGAVAANEADYKVNTTTNKKRH